MNLAQTLGFCALLIGIAGYSAKLCVEGDPLDVIALTVMSIAVGYMGNML